MVLDEVDVLVLDASFPLATIGAATIGAATHLTPGSTGPGSDGDGVETPGTPTPSKNSKAKESSSKAAAAAGDAAGGPRGVQFVFVTATLPKGVAEKLRAEFPGLKVVAGPGLHKVTLGVTLTFRRLAFDERRGGVIRGFHPSVRPSSTSKALEPSRPTGPSVHLLSHRKQTRAQLANKKRFRRF